MQQNNFLNNAFLHHLSIQCADPKSLSSFYSETLGMKSKQIHHQEKTKWLCFGNDRRIIFSPGKKKNLDFAAFSLKDENSLMNFKNILINNKVSISEYETPFFMKGSFGVKDPDNNLILKAFLNQTEARFHLSLNLELPVQKPVNNLIPPGFLNRPRLSLSFLCI